jgi:hypothetical protein
MHPDVVHIESWDCASKATSVENSSVDSAYRSRLVERPQLAALSGIGLARMRTFDLKCASPSTLVRVPAVAALWR